MSDEIVRQIRCEILCRADPENAEKIKAYFREPVETYGISSPVEKEVVKKFYPAVKGDMNLSLQVAEALVKSGVLDEAGIGFKLVRRMVRNVEPTHFDVFDSWVDHVNNWANTDGLSTWLISETVKKDPSLIERLLVWTSSENRWRRRAAAVSLVPIARKGGMLAEVFVIADRLMEDEDDMVRKGVGWLLKEASKEHPGEVRGYLLRWRARTSALVLRYASEKLPREKRVYKTK
jgi:3-methyladenine DNA glycosylase AlkD